MTEAVRRLVEAAKGAAANLRSVGIAGDEEVSDDLWDAADAVEAEERGEPDWKARAERAESNWEKLRLWVDDLVKSHHAYPAEHRAYLACLAEIDRLLGEME